MKKEIENCLTYLANKLSESFVYENWDDTTKIEEMKLGFNTVYDELKKHIDFTKLTAEEAKELRFKKWSSEPEEPQDLWLFPLYLVPIIPEGLEVTYISGEKGKYEKDKMDNDIRFGCVAYGIEIK